MGTALQHLRLRSDAPSNVRFYQRAQLLGVLLTIGCCAFVGAYLVWTWSQPSRSVMLVLTAGSLLGSLLLLFAPAYLLRGGWREAFFLLWSGTLIAIAAVLIGLDGGLDESPLVAIIFLPLIFSTAAYTPVPMFAVAGTIVVTFVVMGIAEGDPPQSTFVLGCSLASAAVICATISRLHHRQRTELARVSRADPLTDCLNRRGLHERLDAELANAARHDRPMSLLVIDLDAFKAVNDRNGHAAGDALLVWTVQRIAGSVRPMDAVGRLGGDEFAVVLAAADRNEATEIARRVEHALAERTAASIGVATYPMDGLDSEELHARADARLYDVKRGIAPSLVTS